MFMGPLEAGKAWSTSGVEGVKRFYNRVWELSNFVIDEDINHSSEEAWRQINKLVKKVGDDIEALKFNTVVAAMMEYSNFWSANKGSVGKDSLNLFVRVMAPYAPHMAEELWQKLGYNKSGKDSIHKAEWPHYDENALVENMMTVVVQINGKVKARVEIDANIAQSVEKAKEIIMNAEKVREIINGKTIANFVYVAGKIANIVLK
jgi:leucyl-tRNA synthetase